MWNLNEGNVGFGADIHVRSGESDFAHSRLFISGLQTISKKVQKSVSSM